MKKKVSFDFDDTLSYEEVQNYARSLIEQGIEIHIVTSRYEDVTRYPFIVTDKRHEDILNVIKNLNINKDNIHFTNMENKYHFFEKNPDFIWHLDNDDQEIALLNWHRDVHNKYVETNIGTIGVLFDYNYIYKCNELLGLSNNETKD
jgi:hypothetical protein